MNIAILGVLAPHKGREIVRKTVEASAGSNRIYTIIGYSDPPLHHLRNLNETGAYREETLVDRINELRIDVIWFPSQVPETYSYTLSAAISSGRPIVATRIGAFVERLAGYSPARLEEVNARPETWMAAFDLALQDSKAISRSKAQPQKAASLSGDNFYLQEYLTIPTSVETRPKDAKDTTKEEPERRSINGLRKEADRRPVKVVLIPEVSDNDKYSPCAYIRLLYPYEWLRSTGEIDLFVTSFDVAMLSQADVFVLQRYSLRNIPQVEQLIARAERIGARVIYDLDDNLFDVEDDHPESELIAERSPLVRTLLKRAYTVTVSTKWLSAILETETSGKVVLIRNAIDGSLLKRRETYRNRDGKGTIGILYMGTVTHQSDFKLIAPVLQKLNRIYPGRLRIGIIGVTNQALPDGIVRVQVPNGIQASYPAFFSWLQCLDDWHVGLAPLLDNEFNRGKSDIKALDYMSMGLVPVVSDVVSYAELPDETVVKVENSPRSWENGLRSVLDNDHYRNQLERNGYSYLMLHRLINKQNIKTLSDWKMVLGINS